MPNDPFTDRSMLFWEKIGRLASEEVILELVKNKCMPWTIILYFAKSSFRFVRLCCRTIPSEII